MRKSAIANQEEIRLDEIAKSYSNQQDVEGILSLYRYLAFKPHFRGNRVLEIGCADGGLTKWLQKDFDQITAIDGSPKAIGLLKKNIRGKNLEAIATLYEKFRPKRRFKTIILAHILEHVKNPLDLLRRSGRWLDDGGVIIVNVPNACSLHRRLGVELGMLTRITDLGPQDIAHGHRRVYTPREVDRIINKSGLKITHSGGLFLKPLSEKQIISMFDIKIVKALIRIGNYYPDISAEIYRICEKK